MAEEPSLPRLSMGHGEQPLPAINPRKRVRLQRSHAPPLSTTSSDPAIFSSDDDPSLENYSQVRRKKRLVGSWYEQQPASSSDSSFGEDVLPVPKPKRAFARHFDSGVWMGSDGDGDDEHAISIPPPPVRPKFATLVALPTRVSVSESAARQVVMTCVDEGNESVDLSSLGLDSLSNSTLEPLAHLSPIPVVAADVPFEPRDPSIKLFLSNNFLKRVPGAIFNIDNLTVLSLRGNGLNELPPAVGKLKNLKTLNVALNALRYLPGSLLALTGREGSLEELIIAPNPFVLSRAKPQTEFCESLSNEGSRNTAPFMTARFLGRTPVQYTNSMEIHKDDFRTALASHSNITDVELEVDQPLHSPITKERARSHKSTDTRVPSLTELVLRSCYHSSSLHEFPQHLANSSLSHLQSLIERTISLKETGGSFCSQCGKLHIVPVMEWLEFWRPIQIVPARDGEHALGENWLERADLDHPCGVPFLMQGCSAMCGPLEMEIGCLR